MLIRVLTMHVVPERLDDWLRYTKQIGFPGMRRQPGCRGIWRLHKHGADGEYQVVFTSFVTECRINEAKRLLAAGNARVFEIAEAVGITDPRYFCRFFKKHTGLSPREYAHLHS